MVIKEHFTKPSLARVAERCFKSSVMFNPVDKEGGVLRFQTNSMSFYQKMNIRQNCIEGNLLRHDQTKLEKMKNQNLRTLKWEFIELRHNMRQYNDHVRSKIKRRKEESNRRKEKRRLEEELAKKLEEEKDNIAPSPPQIVSPPNCTSPTGNESPKKEKSSRWSMSALSGPVGVRIGPELMQELGLSGVEVPKVDGSWGKVSRTALNLHRKWDKERNRGERGKTPKTAKSEPAEEFEPVKTPDRARTSTRSHASYFQTCLARPFSYEEFADRKISCKENEQMWKTQLRDPHPRVYKRFAVSGEENSIAQRQFTERNIEKAKQSRTEQRTVRAEAHVSDKITRMKFTSSKMLEERAELDRKQEEGRLQTDKRIRRHKYQDKNISVADISKERPAYLRYRYTGPPKQEDFLF